jgi:hypothetical protein
MATEQSTDATEQPSEEIDHALSEARWYALGYMGLRNITPFSDRLINALYERYPRTESRVTQQTTLALADGGQSSTETQQEADQ